jgi:hypothetical protein
VLLLGKDIVFQKQRVVNSLCKNYSPLRWSNSLHLQKELMASSVFQHWVFPASLL